MRDKYFDIISQTFDFPKEEFDVQDNELLFNGVPLMEIIEHYGTPLKLNYLPKITEQIQKAKSWFNYAIEDLDYKGNYNYCYCTKSSHFSFVLNEVIKNEVNIETSSTFDINIVENLYASGKITKDKIVVSNGFKKEVYIKKIAELINVGFKNVYTILDNKNELDHLVKEMKSISEGEFDKLKVGIRIATEEDPKFDFYTSRLGIGYKDIVPFYKRQIQNNDHVELRMLHFFVNTGISDSAYYWNELLKCVNVYCDLKEICPELDSLNIGGGFPIKNSLNFSYDYQYMVSEILLQIKTMCNNRGIAEPNIFTEFGSFTVGESGAVIFEIIDQKKQNDREKWNMIDSSFMNAIPDAWAIGKRFIMLAINNWDVEYERVLLGGITCDSDDYYNSEVQRNAIYLPKYDKYNSQYIGFFNTGAYQESVGGYGGIQHCLIPAPKHVIIDRDEDGKLVSRLFAPEQTYESMMKILGYNVEINKEFEATRDQIVLGNND